MWDFRVCVVRLLRVWFDRIFLNQERKDTRISRIMLKEKKGVVSEPGKEGFKDCQDHVERKKGVVSEPGKEGCKDEQDHVERKKRSRFWTRKGRIQGLSGSCWKKKSGCFWTKKERMQGLSGSGKGIDVAIRIVIERIRRRLVKRLYAVRHDYRL